MDLESLYEKVEKNIAKLDFADIWPGFAPLKFALFDSEKCYFNGKYVEKTAAFCANTSIVYEGEQIATWMVAEELESAVLASKIVHEMFHGYQSLSGWNCWPDEIEALFEYEYDAENLGVKLYENELLLMLLDRFERETFEKLLSLRKYRMEKFPYQFAYETKTEEIEGSANYVEWKALEQLDARKAEKFKADMRAVMMSPGRLFPIRISCYYTGALIINALIRAGVYSFDTPDRPFILSLLKGSEISGSGSGRTEELVRAAARAKVEFESGSESIVDTALAQNDIVLNGPLELVYVNIYNARRYKEYITSTFFLMYRDCEGDKMIPGNFVIKMRGEKTIETVYRWK